MESNQTIINHGVSFDFQRINVNMSGGIEAVFFTSVNGAYHSCQKVELEGTASLQGNFEVSYRGSVVGRGRDVLEAVILTAKMNDFENRI